jgi:hypothetical protein
MKPRGVVWARRKPRLTKLAQGDIDAANWDFGLMATVWRAFLLGVTLAVLPISGGASVWTARDLGVVDTEAACVDTARRSMRTFANLFGASALSSGRWMVALDAIDGKPVHALITCTHDARFTRATLIIWSERDTITRQLAADRLDRLWNESLPDGD